MYLANQLSFYIKKKQLCPQIFNEIALVYIVNKNKRLWNYNARMLAMYQLDLYENG